MKPIASKHLYDIQQSAERINEFTRGRTEDEYLRDEMLRSAVERQFQIIGEALNRLSRDDPDTRSLITNVPRIVGFRNVLVHGYDVVDDRVVWDIIQQDLPVLHHEVRDLLDEDEMPP